MASWVFRYALLFGIVGASAACQADQRARKAQPAPALTPGALAEEGASAPWEGNAGWRLVLEREIKGSDREGSQLGAPLHIAVDSRGRIFVVDLSPMSIKVYNPDGSFAGTRGRLGDGPGEFRSPAIAIWRDTLIVQDMNHRRVSIYAPNGTLVREWPSQFNVLYPIAVDDSGRIAIPGAAPRGSIGAARCGNAMLRCGTYYRYRLDGTLLDSMVIDPGSLPRYVAGVSLPFSPRRIIRFDHGGQMVWGDQDRSRITFGWGADTSRSVELASPGRAFAVSDAVRREAGGRYEREARLKPGTLVDSIPRDYPLWNFFAFDGMGDLWVLRPGPSGWEDHWDVFDPEGAPLGSVPAVFEAVTPFHLAWTRDRVYALVSDDQDEPVIRVYRIEHRSGPGPAGKSALQVGTPHP